jgi:hypothetical protein
MQLYEEGLEERFWSKVIKTDTCWLWPGKGKGYGWFGDHRAHRVAFFLTHKRLPKDKLICHRCDNPRCVRPDHLFEGTYQDNAKDAYHKGKLKIMEYSKGTQFKKRSKSSSSDT